MRLIDLDFVFDVPVLVHGDDELSRLRAIVRRLENAPVLPLKNRTAHDTGECRLFCCSNCGYGVGDIFVENEHDFLPNTGPVFKYCPWCGAEITEAPSDPS